MNILFIGDIVGSVGREMVRSHLPLLTSRYQIDLVVANGENAAHGKGITRRIYHQLIGYGIDVMTMGNHTFAKSDLYNFIARHLGFAVSLHGGGAEAHRRGYRAR